MWRTCLLGVALFLVSAAADLRSAPLQQDSESTPTNHWVVHLKAGADADEVARKHGFINLGKMFGDFYRFEKPEHLSRAVFPHISTSTDVKWTEQQHNRLRFKRSEPNSFPVNDPNYNSQWHLHGEPIADVNIEHVWYDLGITGAGINIGIIDDGLQHEHPDIKPQYCAECSTDVNHGDRDPNPVRSSDGHGTEAAGVAAAAAYNGVCGVGAAFGAKLGGIQLISEASSDADEAIAMTFANQLNHVYSCSWGPNDDGRRLEAPGRATEEALKHGVEQGRGGKGSIFVWAAGNGRSYGDNCNYDGYANSRYTIPVGAIDQNAAQAWYSESCAALFVVAPSSGNTRHITTVGLMGHGSLSANCSNDFGGTSSASPLVAGIVALILEANPGITWRDVQHILAQTSTKINPSDPDWNTNSRGFHHSHKFGFGKIDAYAAVTAARAWDSVNEPKTYLSGSLNVVAAIPDLGTVNVSHIPIDNMEFIEQIDVHVQISHSNRGSLAISLISPSGVVSKLQEAHSDYKANISWRYGTVRHWGEQLTTNRPWILQVTDTSSGVAGQLNNWSIEVHGY